MGIFIKSGILPPLKFHLHTLSCHFWLNLWLSTICKQGQHWDDAVSLNPSPWKINITRYCTQHYIYYSRTEISCELTKWYSAYWFHPHQSGTKPTLVSICAWQPKLIANDSSQFHHLVNTGLAVLSFDKWLPIMVAPTCKLDTMWVVYILPIGNGSIRF